MRANRSRDTKPELELRRALHALGVRYRVCARPLPSVRRTADVVFPKAKVAVEVRGCFWHGCPEHHRLPKTNRKYWQAKVESNQKRDQETEELLRSAGWTIVVVWEHEDLTAAAAPIASLVREALSD